MPRYDLQGAAVDHLRELSHYGAEILDSVFSELDEIAASPETIVRPLDRRTLYALREEVPYSQEFSSEDFETFLDTRAYLGRVCTFKWFIENDSRGDGYAVFYSLKPFHGLGSEERMTPTTTNMGVIDWLLSPWWLHWWKKWKEVKAAIDRGNLYREQQRYGDAIYPYERATALDPHHADAHVGLGDAYCGLERYDDAVSAYQQAIALDPQSVDAHAHFNLGRAYANLERYDEAIAAYQQGIALNPNHPYAHNNLADIYLLRGEYDKAQRHFEKRVALSSDTALNALVHLGVLARYKEIDESEKFFRRALTLWEKAWKTKLQSPAELLANKSIALLCTGQREKALETLRGALEQRQAGDTIEEIERSFELLAKSLHPPDGIEALLTLFSQAGR
jgi:Tfp pilus assembly protein PilF